MKKYLLFCSIFFFGNQLLQSKTTLSLTAPLPMNVSCFGGLNDTASANVTVNNSGSLDDASFSYSSSFFCVGGVPQTPTITGLAGGTFTSSPAGLSLNAATGAINLSASTPGNYTVTYITSGPSPNSSNVNVLIIGLANASFTYSAVNYCVSDPNPTPTISGVSGGTFSSSPDGLSINTTTGLINVLASNPGNYLITYTTAGTCPVSSNVSVTISVLDNPSFNYSSVNYCVFESDPTPTITGLVGGTFTSSPVGLILNAATGKIDVSASTPGNYTVSYTTSGTCPSIANVSIIINSSAVTVTNTVNTCDTYTWANNGQTYTTSGMYTGTSNSCVTEILNLTINSVVDNTVTVNGTTLTANGAGLTYQWIDCNNDNQPISGETNQIFTPSQSGNYAVIITQNSCSAISTCQNVNVLANSTFEDFSFSYFPNPTSDILNLNYSKQISEIEIINLLGQTLYNKKLANNEVIIDLSKFSSDTYFVKITSEGQSKIIKVIKY